MHDDLLSHFLEILMKVICADDSRPLFH